MKKTNRAHTDLAYQASQPFAARERKKKSQWRSIESTLKRELKGEGIAVWYRDKEILLNDYNSNANKVWHVLQKIRQKYPFGTTLVTQSKPSLKGSVPQLLWIKKNPQVNGVKRVWKIQETV